GQRNKLIRRDKAVDGVLPARQRFDALDQSCLQLGFRLVVQPQLIGGNGLAQIAEEGEPLQAVLVVTGMIQGESLAPLFGSVHGHVCSRKSVKGSLPCAGYSAMPMLASTCSGYSSTRNDSSRTEPSFKATCRALASS